MMRRSPQFATRKTPIRLVASAMLLCLLVMAEAMAVAHSLDFESHAGSEPCKICISVASFGSAAPGRTAVLLPPAAPIPVAFQEPTTLVAARTEQPTARGPPRAS